MERIRGIAEDFRKDYIFNDSIPVDIEYIIESTMGINVIPLKNLQRDCDMDGFISLDFEHVYVDEDLYNDNKDDRYYRRVRFTIAHEIGHYVLHRSIIDSVKFLSLEEWINFRSQINDYDMSWFETQASEFAGRLLVPKDHLVNLYTSNRVEILKKHIHWSNPPISEDDIITLVAPKICSNFDVSSEVIEKRLNKENIINHIK